MKSPKSKRNYLRGAKNLNLEKKVDKMSHRILTSDISFKNDKVTNFCLTNGK